MISKSVKVLDETQSKNLLASKGIPVPAGKAVGSAEEAVAVAEELGYPIVVKSLGLAHKTDVGGVMLNLRNAAEVSAAISECSKLSNTFLVEKMVTGVVAELIVGVARDEQFGPYLLLGGGGILVEIMKDSISLLLPTTRERVLHALGELNCASLFKGFRGAPLADLEAAADVILVVAGMVENDPSGIIELDINPLMILAEGQGVVAADAYISLSADSTLNQAK